MNRNHSRCAHAMSGDTGGGNSTNAGGARPVDRPTATVPNSLLLLVAATSAEQPALGASIKIQNGRQ